MAYRTSLQYKGTQNQFSVGYTKLVYSKRVHRTSSHYKGVLNQFTVQAYTEPVYSTSVYRTSLQ